VHLHKPDLSASSHSLAATIKIQDGLMLYLMMNAYWEPLTFDLPPVQAPATDWYRIIDTALPSPADITLSDRELLAAPSYRVIARSVVLLGTHKTSSSLRTANTK
jgi:isoamylase